VMTMRSIVQMPGPDASLQSGGVQMRATPMSSGVHPWGALTSDTVIGAPDGLALPRPEPDATQTLATTASMADGAVLPLDEERLFVCATLVAQGFQRLATTRSAHLAEPLSKILYLLGDDAAYGDAEHLKMMARPGCGCSEVPVWRYRASPGSIGVKVRGIDATRVRTRTLDTRPVRSWRPMYGTTWPRDVRTRRPAHRHDRRSRQPTRLARRPPDAAERWPRRPSQAVSARSVPCRDGAMTRCAGSAPPSRPSHCARPLA